MWFSKELPKLYNTYNFELLFKIIEILENLKKRNIKKNERK